MDVAVRVKDTRWEGISVEVGNVTEWRYDRILFKCITRPRIH